MDNLRINSIVNSQFNNNHQKKNQNSSDKKKSHTKGESFEDMLNKLMNKDRETTDKPKETQKSSITTSNLLYSLDSETKEKVDNLNKSIDSLRAKKVYESTLERNLLFERIYKISNE